MTAMTADQVEAALARVDADLEASVARLFEWLRIPSVSTEAAHRADCRRAAEWIAGELSGLGFTAELVTMDAVEGGHPLVVAETPGAPSHRALFYGHYDVQPVDPLALWSHPPFEPRIETGADGRKVIRARGASDDKGQVMTFLEACRAWIAVAGKLPAPVRFLIEGEEEAGGRSMGPFLAEHAERLRADVALVCDTDMWAPGRPAMSASLRGMITGEVRLKAADRDMHSGHYGGPAWNPLRLLAKILADLHDDHHRVTLPGFYDGVAETPAALKASWETLDFDPVAWLGSVGLATPAGEVGRSVLEQRWTRPTAEINGLWGGYIGDGFKTVIPAEAHAKVSFRLVGDQDPAAVWRSFEAHVRRRLPHDAEATITHSEGARAVTLSPDLPEVAAAQAALAAEWGVAPAMIGMGGSIPVVEDFKSKLGMETLLIGFALDDDNIHAPNEKYDVESFHRGIRSWVRVLAALA